MKPSLLKNAVVKFDGLISDYYLSKARNIDDLREYSRKRLPTPIFEYLDGGADDEITLGRNMSDFSNFELMPRQLVDVKKIDPSTTLLGENISFPVICAPTGMTRLFTDTGELSVASAAATADTIYSLSTVSTHSIEEVGAVSTGPKWFQIYVFKDRQLITEFLERCREARYSALCLTIDVPVPGNRERDLRSGMTIPPKLSLSSMVDFCLHPVWLLRYMLSPPFDLANVSHKAPVGSRDLNTLVSYLNQQLDPSVTWEDARWMIQEWGGEFAIKGISSVNDAVRAVEIGASAIILSNHGGRQLDGACAPISILKEVRDKVGDQVEIIVDGGVRRGTDVIKTLGLGGNACMVGRAYLYGLAVAGEKGVLKALELLKTELVRDMALLGCTKVRKITHEYVRERR